MLQDYVYRTVTPARSSVKLGLLNCAGNEIAQHVLHVSGLQQSKSPLPMTTYKAAKQLSEDTTEQESRIA